MLVPIDPTVKESLSLALLTNTINNNICIQDIAPSIDIKIKSLVVDRKDCLIMEIKNIEEEGVEVEEKEEKEEKKEDEEGKTTTPAIGFSIYSNSVPTVLSYSSIFEM